MKIILKSDRDLESMRPACAVASRVLDEVSAFICPGATTREVDAYAAARIKHYGAKSAFLGYRKYPCNICISINDEVVHGLANDRRLQFGDLVSLDVGVVFGGYVGDTARTVAAGGCSLEAQRLLDVTERALDEGIGQAIAGNRVTDISRAIQNYVESNGFSVVREFVGHGVGRSVHEDPQVPNYVDAGFLKDDMVLKPGLVLAIEPMVNAGTAEVITLKDKWTVVTQDRKLSAHFEHTVAVTEEGPQVLTVA